MSANGVRRGTNAGGSRRSAADRQGRRIWWERRSQAMVVLLIFVLVLFIIQLWLITIALEEHLAERSALALPTFLASAFCFLINLGLLKYLNDLDREKDKQ